MYPDIWHINSSRVSAAEGPVNDILRFLFNELLYIYFHKNNIDIYVVEVLIEVMNEFNFNFYFYFFS